MYFQHLFLFYYFFFFFFLMIRRPPRSTLFPYNDALPISRQSTAGSPKASIRLCCRTPRHCLTSWREPVSSCLGCPQFCHAGPVADVPRRIGDPVRKSHVAPADQHWVMNGPRPLRCSRE